MREPRVMDTNVAVVANGKARQAGDKCVATCLSTLIELRERHCVLLDQQGLILQEYRQHLSPSGQPGPGDAFFKWLWNNQGNAKYCRRIFITPAGESFQEFPDDPSLARFDRSDRKFVAVAVASQENPSILNASDTDWWEHREALSQNGVEILFLCPELMQGAG